MGARVSLLLAALAALNAGACRSEGRDAGDYAGSPDRLDALPDWDQSELARARLALDAGDWGVARAILDTLAAARPDDVAVAALAQEAHFAPASAEQRARLVDAARSRAARDPQLVPLLLAARIEPEPGAAAAFARLALDAAPHSAWAHYALAFVEARAGNWSAAQTENERALALDPGHRSAARLEAAILARAGRGSEAIVALESWLEAVADDPRFSPEALAAARLDLAHLLVLDSDEERALEVLAEVGGSRSAEVRRACLEAAAEQARGRAPAALDAAREAQLLDPEELTPFVQEALLLQHHIKDPVAARAAWERVLEAQRGDSGLGALLQSLRARVTLERSEPGAR